VIAFLDEFPEFKFSQSQSSTYRLIEEFDPELYGKIKAAVASERWELLGGMSDEADTNLSSGEGIVRSLLLGQLYFREKFGKIARTGWLPDNFGHIASLPQLLRLAGLEFFYFHRCAPLKGLFWWEAPGGTRVLAYSNDTYNQAIDSSIRSEADKFNRKYRRTMLVCGVGDHGGGPTRRDIRNALLYAEAKDYPKTKFSTAEEFFRAALADGTDYPVHEGEMQFWAEGCYTTISEIKRLNRACENALFGAEVLTCLAPQSNPVEARRILEPAWQILTFNQFHDILCGSAIHESNRDSVADYAGALATAERLRSASLRRLADSVATEGPGQPVVVFNQLPRERTDLVEAEVFSHIPPPHIKLPSWGDFDSRGVTVADASVELTDHQGKAIPCQVVGGKLFPNGYRMRVLLRASDVPACGYRTYHCSILKRGSKSQDITIKGTKIETDLLSLTVDSQTGRITRLYDKRLKRNILKRSGGNALRVYMEKPHPMTAWLIGPISTVHELNRAERVTVIEKGPVRAGIEVEYRFNRSKLIQRIYLYAGMSRVDFELEAHWFEQGDATTDAPMLRVEFPLMLSKGNFICDTPFCVVERPRNGREVPAQKWVDLSDDQWGAALLSDSKYGYSCAKNVLRMTVLRSSYDPDRYPDQGVHHFRYALLPHEGDWRSGVMNNGLGFNLPLLGIETAPRSDGQAPTGSFLSLEPDNVFLSAVKPAQQGDALIVRFWEAEGRTTTARLCFANPVRSATRVNLLEDPLTDVAQPHVDGNTVTVKTQPHEVVSLRLEF
jgi:alpha-mannosidase